MSTFNGRQHSKSLYHQLMEGLYDALLVTDPNGHIIELNPRAKEYFLYDPEEVWDKPVANLIPGVTVRMIERIRKGLNDARHIMLDARCQRRDGTSFAAEVTISVIDLMNSGDLVFTIRNTERRRKQWQALRSLSNAFDNAQSACFVCGADRLFRSVNAAFVALFDLSGADAAVGHPFDDLMPDPPLPELFARALAGEEVSCRIVADTEAQEIAEVEVQMAPDRQGKNEIIGVVGSILNV